jgi:hypothetical protein
VLGVITSLHTLAGAAVLVGVIGIVLAITAQQRSIRAVRECKDLVRGAIGSRGTADPRALRDVGLVRYDALQEMSGQMSFSLALLNAAGDGVVVSSINGRAETRTYAKTVKASEGVEELSPEEEAAIRSAKMGLGFDQPADDQPHARDGRGAHDTATAAR